MHCLLGRYLAQPKRLAPHVFISRLLPPRWRGPDRFSVVIMPSQVRTLAAASHRVATRTLARWLLLGFLAGEREGDKCQKKRQQGNPGGRSEMDVWRDERCRMVLFVLKSRIRAVLPWPVVRRPCAYLCGSTARPPGFHDGIQCRFCGTRPANPTPPFCPPALRSRPVRM